MASAANLKKGIEWSASERRAWAWPDRLRPSDWVGKAPIYIPDNSINPEPGPYDLGRTPYLRELFDLTVDPVVREIWFYKPTQVGFTRFIINLICYWMDQDPGAIGLLMPDEDTVEEVFAEELKPTIDASPVMRRHRTTRKWDNTRDEIWLDTGPIFGLYAGSVQKLARRSLRYVIGDEINKYRPFRNEASPIQLLLKRTSNWLHRARAIFGSTPTTRDGNITVGYESCPDKRTYRVPCPGCGEYQYLLWSGVKGFRDAPGSNKFERANYVRLNQPAYYECARCKEKITDAQKGAMVNRGVWASDGQQVEKDGTLTGERIVSAKVGLHLTSLVSPWLTFSDLAAEFIEAEGDHDKSRDFRNARMAEPWDEVVKSVRPSKIRDKLPMAGPSMVVPKWAVALIATVDTQDKWFAFSVRAWGWGFKSALVHYGECHTPGHGGFDELYKIIFESRYAIDGGNEFATPVALLIDSGGNRTDEVYQFALRDIGRIIPCKGASHPLRKPYTVSALPNGVNLRLIDTTYYKDMLSRLVDDPDPTKWLPHRDVPDQYCLEMASEHKIVNPKNKRIEWVPTGNMRQEAWDCEMMQCAGADMANVGAAVPSEEIQSSPSPNPVESNRGNANPLNYRGKW